MVAMETSSLQANGRDVMDSEYPQIPILWENSSKELSLFDQTTHWGALFSGLAFIELDTDLTLWKQPYPYSIRQIQSAATI